MTTTNEVTTAEKLAELPPLPEPYQREVYATSDNTPSVRKGFEVGGYIKSPDLFTADQMCDYARAVLAATPAAPHPDTKDAERYRWLREHGDAGCTEKDGYGGQTLRMGDCLDAAIDAAMAGKGKGSSNG